MKGSTFVDSQDYEDVEGSVDEDDDALHVPLDIIGRIASTTVRAKSSV